MAVALDACVLAETRPELHCGDTKVVLRATRGLLEPFFEEGSKSNSEAGPGETCECSKSSCPARERSSGFVFTPSSVRGVVCIDVRGVVCISVRGVVCISVCDILLEK